MTLENQCSIAYFSLELTLQQLIANYSSTNNYRYKKITFSLLNENEIELISQKRRTRRSAFIYY
jgi:hypothetical protein